MASFKKLEKRIDDALKAAFKEYWINIAGFGGNPPSQEDERRWHDVTRYFTSKVKRIIDENKGSSSRVQRYVDHYIETRYPVIYEMII